MSVDKSWSLAIASDDDYDTPELLVVQDDAVIHRLPGDPDTLREIALDLVAFDGTLHVRDGLTLNCSPEDAANCAQFLLDAIDSQALTVRHH